MLFIAAALCAVLLSLVALKAWAKAKERPAVAAPQRPSAGMAFETFESRVDDLVREGERWWPHLRGSLLFWVSCVFTVILVALDYAFGWSQAGLVGVAVVGSLFAAADIAIPIIALKDRSDGEADWKSTLLVWVCTFASLFVVIGSTAEIASVTGATKDISKMSIDGTIQQIAIWETERDSITVDRGYKALADLAKATEEAAEREGSRTRCGEKCEKLKKEAVDYKARAEDAKRKEDLIAKIANAREALTKGEGGTARLDSAPLASAIEDMTLGAIKRDVARKYFLTVLGIVAVIASTFFWLVVGDMLGRSIRRELKKRHAIADEMLTNAGRPRKYTTVDPAGLLPPPKLTAANDPGVTINYSEAQMLVTFKNDEALLIVNGLFSSLLLPATDGSVTLTALYDAYRVAVLSADPNASYINKSVMYEKLSTISLHRKDVRFATDGTVHGWLLKPAAERKLEAAE